MKAYRPFLFSVILLTLGAGALPLTSCKTLKIRTKERILKNQEGSPRDYAVLRMRGFQFWMKKDEKRNKLGRTVKTVYEEMRLRPGSYLLGFRRNQPRLGGAAYCSLKPNRVYSFRIADRKYMPKSGIWYFEGKCFFDPERSENEKLGWKKTKDGKSAYNDKEQAKKAPATTVEKPKKKIVKKKVVKKKVVKKKRKRYRKKRRRGRRGRRRR